MLEMNLYCSMATKRFLSFFFLFPYTSKCLQKPKKLTLREIKHIEWFFFLFVFSLLVKNKFYAVFNAHIIYIFIIIFKQVFKSSFFLILLYTRKHCLTYFFSTVLLIYNIGCNTIKVFAFLWELSCQIKFFSSFSKTTEKKCGS